MLYTVIAMSRKLLAACALVALNLAGSSNPSGLTVTCRDGQTSQGSCFAGKVTFNGTDYPNEVHVKVERTSDGSIYDDWDYRTGEEGRLRFTETLSPPDDYKITLSGDNLDYTMTLTISTE